MGRGADRLKALSRRRRFGRRDDPDPPEPEQDTPKPSEQPDAGPQDPPQESAESDAGEGSSRAWRRARRPSRQREQVSSRWTAPDAQPLGIIEPNLHHAWLTSIRKGKAAERWRALRDALLALGADWHTNAVYLLIHHRLRKAAEARRRALAAEEPYRAHLTEEVASAYREAVEDLDRCLGALYDAQRDAERAHAVAISRRQHLDKVMNPGTWAAGERGCARRPVEDK